MNLTNINTIKNLCKEFNIRPSKKLGQNFLINENILDKIISASELKRNDVILEIGPGFGVLTMELLKNINNLIVIEKDKRLAEFLRQEIKKYSNKEIKDGVEIINSDILKIDVGKILQQDPSTHNNSKGRSGPSSAKATSDRQAGAYKIISNLPYQITSPVLWKFLNEVENSPAFASKNLNWTTAGRPELMVLMVQKEVANRIVSKQGQMSILSVMCQFYADCEIISQVPRNNFWPEPEVDSAIIRLKIKKNKIVSWLHRSAWSHLVQSNKQAPCLPDRQAPKRDGANTAELFFKVVKIGFSAKRKMLKNNLSAGLNIPAVEVERILEKVGLNKKVRAQELSVNKWILLVDSLKSLVQEKN